MRFHWRFPLPLQVLFVFVTLWCCGLHYSCSLTRWARRFYGRKRRINAWRHAVWCHRARSLFVFDRNHRMQISFRCVRFDKSPCAGSSWVQLSLQAWGCSYLLSSEMTRLGHSRCWFWFVSPSCFNKPARQIRVSAKISNSKFVNCASKVSIHITY